MEHWYCIISDKPYKKFYCDDYDDTWSFISTNSMLEIPISKFIGGSIFKDKECPDYSIYKDGELIEVVTGEKLTEIYYEKNKEKIANYAKKNQEEELKYKKMVEDFNSLSSNMEGINNAIKDLVDDLNRLNDILNERRRLNER